MQHIVQYAPAGRPLSSATSFDPVGTQPTERAIELFKVQPVIEKASPVTIGRTDHHPDRPPHNRLGNDYVVIGIQNAPDGSYLGRHDQAIEIPGLSSEEGTE